MRAESRIALVLVVCLLGGLGFFVQQRLKSETNDITQESLAEFIEADDPSSQSADSDETPSPSIVFTPAPVQADEPPTELFASEETTNSRATTPASGSTASSAVSPNPWSRATDSPSPAASSSIRSTGVAVIGGSEPDDDGPAPVPGTRTWAAAEVTQVSGTTPAPASSSANPFTTTSQPGTPHVHSASRRQEFTPQDLIVEEEVSSTNDSSEAAVFLPTESETETNATRTAASNTSTSGNPFGPSPAPASAVSTADGRPAPSDATRSAEPVFYQTPAAESPAVALPDESSPTSPFTAPASPAPSATTSPDPFAPAPANPSPSTGNAPAPSATPTFNFTSPATTQTPSPAQSTPAPSLTPTPSTQSNPFGNASTTSSGGITSQPAYSPQGLPNAPGGDPGTKIYEVEPGDNYWTISRKVYGAGRYFSALAEYNKPRIENPERLAPGMIVLVPTTDILHARFDDIISGPSPNDVIEPAGFFVEAGGAPMYRVGEADTLSDIAQRYLGRSSRWVQIYGMNREVIENADALKPGTVLALPPDAAPFALAPEEAVIR